MVIKKFTKLKNGMYRLELDENTFDVYEDLILKYDLLIHKKIDEDLKKIIQKENEMYIAYDIAISYLKIKMRSKKEVKEQLLKKNVSIDIVNKILEKLTLQGYLNDESFSQAFIHDQIALTNNGPLKIKELLLSNEINCSIIDKYISIFDEELQKQRINKYIQKQLKQNKKSKLVFKRKTVDSLINAGYEKKLIIEVLEKVEFDDSDIKTKEHEKIYNKLSRKYSGKELEFKIKQKMYQKGFFE